jgi:hypothetical protein
MADPGYFSRCVAECIRHFAPQLAWSAGGRAEHRIQRACSAVEAMRLTRRRGLGKLAWNGKREIWMSAAKWERTHPFALLRLVCVRRGNSARLSG